MDEIDEKIKSVFSSSKYEISEKCVNRVNETLKSLPEKKEKDNKKLKLVFATCCFSLILISGIAFAKEIHNLLVEKFNSGETINKAVEYGYVAHSNGDYVSSNIELKISNSSDVIDIFNTSVKTNDFFIDNNILCVEYEIVFDSEINLYKNLNQRVIGNEEYIDYENFGSIFFTDINIVDDQGRIIYFEGNEKSFYDLCEEKNLDYNFKEFNEKYFDGNAISLITEIDPETNTINLTYKYVIENEMPDSKEIYINLNEISFAPKNELRDLTKRISLNGNWKFDLDVPESMSNRTNYYYELINCDNEDFELNEAKITNTGLDISLCISNIVKPVYPEILGEKESEYMNSHPNGIVINTKEDFINVYGDDLMIEELYINYYKDLRVVLPKGYPGVNWIERSSGCYVLNSNGEKFDYASSQNSGYLNDFSQEENKYYFHGTFEMTKYEATDEIDVVIDFKGEPVQMKLERIKN